MTKFRYGAALVATAVFLSASAQAGEPGVYGSKFLGYGGYCHFVEDAVILTNYTDVRELRAEVLTRYEHASDVSNSNSTIYSQSPLFVWAGEAKISCAKSYGYLRKPRKWRKRPDFVMLQKCDCFYQRMLAYLGH